MYIYGMKLLLILQVLLLQSLPLQVMPLPVPDRTGNPFPFEELPGPGAVLHPLHLSVTNIVIEKDKLSLEMKTFRDDWETAYYHFKGSMLDLSLEENREGEWLAAYLARSLRISRKAGGNELELVLDSSTVSGENMHLHLHCPCKGQVKTLYIYNSLLTDVFPDQTNLVILVKGDREQGMKFDRKKTKAEMRF